MKDGLTSIQLTTEAASVIKQSIAMARRKGHCQATPLHVVVTLLNSPSGILRQACLNSNPNISHPLQYRSLELFLHVALNRLPTTSQNNISPMDPSLSNSLVAAFKRARARAQALARKHGRQPSSADKIELDQLVISILDDPRVSMVMREAGYSSPTVSDTLQQGRQYEVFMSFRGEDTRASFTSHLYASLQNAGIIVFKDDESLPRGHHISDSLLLAIEQSQISVVVFSRNYADSRWCLKELEKIMECHRTIGQVVVPVFYDVDPSEVRHQTGQVGKAFQNLLDRMSIDLNSSGEMEMLNSEINLQGKRWRETLREAAAISGVVVLDSRNESEAIKNIVENVTHLLDKSELFIADNPVGIESRVQDMIQLLDHKLSNNVVLLGIWGMGGIGKTTIAKAIYNKIGRNFEGRSFLAQIREVWGQDGGQVHLQEQLLCDIDKETKIKIPNIELGKSMLKERLCHRRVLLILDDVNKLHQLNALCGSREWFGPGSRIIITTRDMHILRGRRVDEVYTLKGMNESESIELFSWNAFKQPTPRQDFIELSRNVIAYSGGLPLALEVIGSYLFDMDVAEWKFVLEKLKEIPNDEVQEKLKISFDGLNDNTEREIFLDIACFFIGMDRNDVIHILNGSGLFAENGIRVLVERSLVTVDEKNKLGMHDLLRDMGREIIRAISPKEPEERSRLWFHDNVLDVIKRKWNKSC